MPARALAAAFARVMACWNCGVSVNVVPVSLKVTSFSKRRSVSRGTCFFLLPEYLRTAVKTRIVCAQAKTALRKLCMASARAQAAAALVCADRVVAGLSGRSRHGQNKNGGRRGGRGPSERGAHLYARVPPGHFLLS